jgi:polygalacturonase
VPRTGRIKFGTESNGGFKNVALSNCIFDGCWGLALETVDGGLLEDVTITNITMRDVATPIFLRLGARMRGPADMPVGTLRRVVISNVVCSSVAASVASIISGIPGHVIEDVKLSNVLIHHAGGGTREDASRALAEKETSYPEPNMFGATPAQGLFIRHVRGIEMSQLKVISQSRDERPAFVLDDVQTADFSHIDAACAADVPVFSLNHVEDFRVSGSKQTPDTKLDRAEQKKI